MGFLKILIDVGLVNFLCKYIVVHIIKIWLKHTKMSHVEVNHYYLHYVRLITIMHSSTNVREVLLLAVLPFLEKGKDGCMNIVVEK